MSFTYMRIDALAKLANCGASAVKFVEDACRDILLNLKANTLPEEMSASLEVIEYAHRAALPGGKMVIAEAVECIIEKLEKEKNRRELEDNEKSALDQAYELRGAFGMIASVTAF